MSYKVKYSDVAIKDISRMTNDVFAACLDKRTTNEYVNGLIKKINEKAVFPESGIPLLLSKKPTEHRYIIYKSYLAFYRIKGNDLIVERVLFGKSEYLKYLLIEEN